MLWRVRNVIAANNPLREIYCVQLHSRVLDPLWKKCILNSEKWGKNDENCTQFSLYINLCKNETELTCVTIYYTHWKADKGDQIRRRTEGPA